MCSLHFSLDIHSLCGIIETSIIRTVACVAIICSNPIYNNCKAYLACVAILISLTATSAFIGFLTKEETTSELAFPLDWTIGQIGPLDWTCPGPMLIGHINGHNMVAPHSNNVNNRAFVNVYNWKYLIYHNAMLNIIYSLCFLIIIMLTKNQNN